MGVHTDSFAAPRAFSCGRFVDRSQWVRACSIQRFDCGSQLESLQVVIVEWWCPSPSATSRVEDAHWFTRGEVRIATVLECR